MPGLKNRLQQLLASGPGSSKLREWLVLSGITGGAQFLIQAIGLLSGIIIIRLLPTDEYALYTLANTMLGTMMVLADGGISSGVIAESGKVWKDKEKLGTALTTGLDLRKKFAIGSLVVSAPVLIYLLNFHGASWWMSVIIVLSLIPAFISSLTGAIFNVPLTLKQDIKPLQKNHLIENLARFVAVFSLFLLPWTFIALLGAGIPKIFTNIRLRKYSIGYADWSQKPDPEVRKRILKVVKRLMPGAIYFVVSGHISIWLISFFGTTDGVAEIGALERIAIMLTILSQMLGILVYPRFARMSQNSPHLLLRFLQIMGGIVLICIGLVFGVWLFSDEILWVLGDKYSDLNYALVLAISARCIVMIGGGIFKMSTQRGWAVHPGLSIPMNIAGIIVGVLLLDVSSLIGVLYFNIFTATIQLFVNAGYFFFAYFKAKNRIDPEAVSHEKDDEL